MNEERIYKLILSPVVTEKSAGLSDSVSQVVFKVLPNATKPEVKVAVEKLFSVNVEGVRILNVKGKAKRTRFGLGRRSDWKKAYVRLAAGQEIDFSSVAE